MPSLESQLLSSITRHLKRLAREDPAFCWRKRHGDGMAKNGDPDITGLWRGIHFEMELKCLGHHATPLQCYRLEEWKRAGAHCFLIHSLAEFKNAMDTLREVV